MPLKQNEPNKSITYYLGEIMTAIAAKSGYPYPPDSQVDPNKAIAYGLTMGTLARLRAEWDLGK